MAIKVNRPADFGAEGVVVYVAKSIDDVNRIRDAFTEAEVPAELPAAAILALFESGKKSVSIRVAPDHFRAAQKVIDELFPPEIIELPPLDGEEPAGTEPRSEAAAIKKTLAAEGGEDRAGPDMEGMDLTPTSRGISQGKLEKSALKIIFIALGSLLVPVAGILIASFAIYAGWWCRERINSERGRLRAHIAMGLGIAAILWHIGIGVYFAWYQGWIG